MHLLNEIGVGFEFNDYLPVIRYDSKYIVQQTQNIKEVKFDASQLIKHKNEIYKDLQKQGVPAIPIAVHFLRQLVMRKQELGVKFALASSASHSEIHENIKQIDVQNGFDVIISGKNYLNEFKDPEGTNKPKPYIYQKYAQMLGVDPKDCIVFEDTKAWVDAAVGAGCIVYAVPNQFTLQHDFTGAHKVISSFAILPVVELVNPS